MSKTLLGYIPNKSMNIKQFEYINSDGHTFLFPFRVGDIVKVKLIGFDRNNKPKLSYKAVDQKTGEDLEK